MAFSNWSNPNLARFNSSASAEFLDFVEESWDNSIKNERDHKPSKTFAPSALRCERKSWFRLRGVEPDKVRIADRTLDFTAKVGTALHEVLQGYISQNLGDSWLNVAEHLSTIYPLHEFTCNSNGFETQVQLDHPPIKFACDGLIRWKDQLYLLEIKSSEFSSFQDLTDPKPQHISQVEAYCTLLHVNHVLFIYIDRQYGSLKCFEHTVNQYNMDDLSEMFERVQKMAESGIAPDGLPSGDSWCSPSMCEWYKKCQEYGRW